MSVPEPMVQSKLMEEERMRPEPVVPERDLPVVTSRAKRALDVFGAVVGMVLLAPLYFLIALLIRLDSRGPALFRQERAGLYGHPFQMLKFRTMQHGSSDEKHREYVRGLVNGEREQRNGSGVYKLVADDRTTRIGHFLRRTSLDELPQLMNILRGEMSLVGPRPAISYEVQLYEDWQRERLNGRPGLTGLWQVSGRNRLSYRRMCELDAQYIRDWSFTMDLRILLKTIPVVLTNSGGAH